MSNEAHWTSYGVTTETFISYRLPPLVEVLADASIPGTKQQPL
jgi:hypothetical protein